MSQIHEYGENNLPIDLSKPAKRALSGAGLFRLEQLTKIRVEELLKLHGVGPKSIKQLRQALHEQGLSFFED